MNEAAIDMLACSFLEAEKDCSRGLQLQPKNVKALWRRGIALRELGRMNEARKGLKATNDPWCIDELIHVNNLDFETGLTIEPSNKSLLDELKKLPAAKPAEKPKSKKVFH